MEVGLGDYVSLTKGSTVVSGLVNGIKVNNGELERVCLEELDWLLMDEGWSFIHESEDDDAEI
jgi:hypothetical protein